MKLAFLVFFLYCWCSPWSEKVVLIIFFGNFFFGVKFVSAYIDAFFNKKNGGQIFSPKKDQPGGGSEGGLAKDQTFSGFFFRLPSLRLCVLFSLINCYNIWMFKLVRKTFVRTIKTQATFGLSQSCVSWWFWIVHFFD